MAMWPIVALVVALPLAGQASPGGRTITEFTLGTRLLRTGAESYPAFDQPDKGLITLGLGRVARAGARTSLGGMIAMGSQDGQGFIAIGPRVRYHPSVTTTIDVTPSAMLTRSEELPGPFLLDAAVMHKDQIGVSIQVAAGRREIFTPFDATERVTGTSVAAGVRLGGKPGRIGGAIAIATVTAVLLLLFGNWS